MESIKIINYKPQFSDMDVIKRVLSGEKELFEILLRRNNQTLYRVIRSYLKNDDDIRDAMQEAYLKAYDKLQQFQGNSAFSTWLIRIGINEALLRIRTIKKTRPLYANEDLQSEKISQISDSKQMNPEKKIIHKEMEALIEQAIDSLPANYRTIYMLKEVEGLENEEIASCLSLSGSNVKVRLHRAKNLLKNELYKLSSEAEIFEFGQSNCDHLVNNVMNRIR